MSKSRFFKIMGYGAMTTSLIKLFIDSNQNSVLFFVPAVFFMTSIIFNELNPESN